MNPACSSPIDSEWKVTTICLGFLFLQPCKRNIRFTKQHANIYNMFHSISLELDGFRYRANDAWRAVTKIAVREARLKEIKAEMLNSVKLKAHFADNPRDAQILRHDKALHTVRQQAHLKNVPDYIVPPTLRKMTGNANHSNRKGRKRHFKGGYSGGSAAKKKFEKRKADPLRSLVAKK